MVRILCFLFVSSMIMTAYAGQSVPADWKAEWPNTNFSQSIIDFETIISGGPPKDGIPSIDEPDFAPIHKVNSLPDQEPVITVTINDQAKAYPLRILMWHEIVNDKIAGTPIAVTYCPLCDSAVVFDRRLDGQILEFGTTGKLRFSDLVMYDRQSESWWQQFSGVGIVGKYVDRDLKRLPNKVESFASFKEKHPGGLVLRPPENIRRDYGKNPYGGYDDPDNVPFLYQGDYDLPIPPLSRVVVVGKDAWPLKRLQKDREIKHKDLHIRITGSHASPLDESEIRAGRGLPSVEVVRIDNNGNETAVPHDVTFAFAFYAFHRADGKLHLNRI